MVEGRSCRTERHAGPSERCQTVLMYSLAVGPCVSADTFEDSLLGDWSRPDPPSSAESGARAVPAGRGPMA